VWSAQYSAFGRTNITTPTATDDKPVIASSLRFPGQVEDAETGLYYNWHRYYDPEVGRYVTADPIGLDGGINFYGYAKTNPLNWYDSMGLKEECVFNPISYKYTPGKIKNIIDGEKEKHICGMPYPEIGPPTPPGEPNPRKRRKKPSPWDWIGPGGKCVKRIVLITHDEQLYMATAWGKLVCVDDCGHISEVYGYKRWEAADVWRKVEGSETEW
jgi:RHS repeat-associated protein